MNCKKYWWLISVIVTCYAHLHIIFEGRKKLWLNSQKGIDCKPPVNTYWKYENGIFKYCILEINTKPYHSCQMLTDYWIVNNSINSVFIEIHGEGRNCSKCENFFTLKGFLGTKNNSDSLNLYETIFKVPRPGSFDFFDRTFYRYNETYVMDLKGKSGIRLAFYAERFCGDFRNLKLFYYYCPIASELLRFKSSFAPTANNSPLKIEGKCIENSAKLNATQDYYMDCFHDGNYTVHGECICDPGFTKASSTCQACPSKKYKKDPGNEECRPCGRRAESKSAAGKSCVCETNSYRQEGSKDNDETPCYRPPGPPTNVEKKNVTAKAATIIFNPPKEIGDGPLGKYVINCDNCPSSDEPFPISGNGSPITINGLGAFTDYELSIYNENNITNLTGEYRRAKIKFKTLEGKPGMIRNLKNVTDSNGNVILSWEKPINIGSKKLRYVIVYGSKTKITYTTSFTIKSGTSDQRYTIKIYAEATINGNVVKGDEFMYPKVILIRGRISLGLTVGVTVGLVAFVIIVASLLFCIWKKRHPPYLQNVRMEDGTVQSSKRFLSPGKLYVDPTTYNQVDDAVLEFSYELNRDHLTVGDLIGGGEFAEVFRGTYIVNGKSKDVAIKTLKAGASKKDRDDFLSEAAILGQFSDPNVISLEGVVMKERPYLIIMEFMFNGALDSYLRKNDMQFQVEELLCMARCVASGMAYLSEIGFIHRDLAARNILVDEYNVCKVTDFGMSRELKLDDTYETQGGKIPVRWTAPEAIQYKKFTSASDIWSYGILLWEIMSFGERPYWHWDNYTVLDRLNNGYRLPPPMNCRKVIHNLMLECWNKDRTKRPKFKEIRSRMEQWIRSPELLQEIASVVKKTDENLDYTVLQTVNMWLQAIGMEQYTENFINNNIATPKQILNMTLQDLGNIGIEPIGHKKKIMKAILNTKQQVEERHNIGSTTAPISPVRKSFSFSRKKLVN